MNYYTDFLPIIKRPYKKWFEMYQEGDKSLDKYLYGMIENKLTENEVTPILAFTAQKSNWVNRTLRNGDLLNEINKKEYVEHLDAVLEKIKSPTEKFVYRMESEPNEKEILKWFQNNIGVNICVPYFLSTSKYKWEWESLIWEIEILSNNSFAKDISNISVNPSEREVLFKRNSKFVISDVHDNVISLRELRDTTFTRIELIGAYYLNN